MNLETIFHAIRDLGEGKWKYVELGLAEDNQTRLYYDRLDIPNLRAVNSLIWPTDVEVAVGLKFLKPVEVPWLASLGSSLAEPLVLVGSYRGEPIASISGLLISRDFGSDSIEDDPIDESWALPLPDGQGRIIRWHLASLEFALAAFEGISVGDVRPIFSTIGISFVGEELN